MNNCPHCGALQVSNWRDKEEWACGTIREDQPDGGSREACTLECQSAEIQHKRITELEYQLATLMERVTRLESR